MPLEAPPWWYGRRYAMVSHALLPIAAIYGALAARRMAQPPQATSALPVICVGNFTAGGTGKTPFALHIASRLIAQGHCPVFLTRGYGGSLKGPVLVDRDAHTAQDVGDEPLLLAASASTVVARAREMGLALIAERNAHADSAARHDVIIMDDGLQNPRVKKDLTFALIDAERGLGNARVIPAGPLRAPPPSPLRLPASALCTITTASTWPR
ncbi:MAG: tetraacyldisaccharide 4'-kinase [Pseudomonadota bacterium]